MIQTQTVDSDISKVTHLGHSKTAELLSVGELNPKAKVSLRAGKWREKSSHVSHIIRAKKKNLFKGTALDFIKHSVMFPSKGKPTTTERTSRQLLCYRLLLHDWSCQTRFLLEVTQTVLATTVVVAPVEDRRNNTSI